MPEPLIGPNGEQIDEQSITAHLANQAQARVDAQIRAQLASWAGESRFEVDDG